VGVAVVKKRLFRTGLEYVERDLGEGSRSKSGAATHSQRCPESR
jgi:hypothetical protein